MSPSTPVNPGWRESDRGAGGSSNLGWDRLAPCACKAPRASANRAPPASAAAAPQEAIKATFGWLFKK